MGLPDVVYRFDPEGEDAAQYGDSDVADQIDWDNPASFFETFHLPKPSSYPSAEVVRQNSSMPQPAPYQPPKR